MQKENLGTVEIPRFFGAPGGNRTHGLFIRSELLYPLSYERTYMAKAFSPLAI